MLRRNASKSSRSSSYVRTVSTTAGSTGSWTSAAGQRRPERLRPSPPGAAGGLDRLADERRRRSRPPSGEARRGRGRGAAGAPAAAGSPGSSCGRARGGSAGSGHTTSPSSPSTPSPSTAITDETRSGLIRPRLGVRMRDHDLPRKGRLMRTVTGRTDRVVVVGAGLGGLACALHLAGAGREVIVLERELVPGRPGRTPVHPGVRVRHRPDRADHARADRRGARRGRRGAGRLADAHPARPGLPGLLPRRLDPRRDHRAGPDGRRDRRVCGPARGRRLPALRRRSPPSCGGSSATTSSPATSTPRWDLLRPGLLRLLRAGAFRRLSAKSASSSRIRAPSGSSRSRPCTPGVAPQRASAALRRHRLPRHGRRRPLPARRHARRAAGDGRRRPTSTA